MRKKKGGKRDSSSERGTNVFLDLRKFLLNLKGFHLDFLSQNTWVKVQDPNPEHPMVKMIEPN